MMCRMSALRVVAERAKFADHRSQLVGREEPGRLQSLDDGLGRFDLHTVGVGHVGGVNQRGRAACVRPS